MLYVSDRKFDIKVAQTARRPSDDARELQVGVACLELGSTSGVRLQDFGFWRERRSRVACASVQSQLTQTSFNVPTKTSKRGPTVRNPTLANSSQACGR